MATYNDFEDEDTRRERRRNETGDYGMYEEPTAAPPPVDAPIVDETPAPAPAAEPAATPVTPAAPVPQAAFQAPATPSSYTPWTNPQVSAPSVRTPGITDEVTRILMARLKELSNPSDVASDPLYQQSVRQYQIGQLRDADRQRKALAERSAATGGTTRSGGFNVGVRAIQERAGENASKYRSDLAMERLQSREEQLVQAISAARAVGQDDIANQLELQRLQLQKELGYGDLALRGELGYGNLGLSYANLIQQANRDATRAALEGGS